MFYLFAGYKYYPEGGVHDFQTMDNVIQNLRDLGVVLHHDWWHIADENMIIVEASYGT